MSEAAVGAPRRLHIGTILFRALALLRSFAVPIIGALYASRSLDMATWVAAGLSLVMLAPAILSWWRFRYSVDDRAIVIESGVFSRNRRVIPLSRVADVDIERGPLQRLFALATVRIETGGADKDEGLLDSVSMAEAERLRAILRGARQLPVSALNPQAKSERLLFQLPVPVLLRFGFFSFSFASLSLIIAGISGIVSQVDDLRGDLFASVKDVAERNLVGGLSITIVILIGVALVALALLTSIARVFLRDAGFRLTATPNGFRRVNGLITRREALIPRQRIQIVAVSSGPVWRAIDRAALFARITGGAGDAAGVQAIAPFASRAQIDLLIAEMPDFRLPANGMLQAVSPLHAIGRAVSGAAFAVIAIAIAGQFAPIAFYAFGLVPVFVAMRWIDARSHRYAFADGLLWVQRGFRRRTLSVVPAANIHVLAVSRSWRERRFGLATLWVDTAGGTVTIEDIARDEAERLRATLLAHSGRKSGTDR